MEQTEDLMEHMLAVALCADAAPTNDNHQGAGVTLGRWVEGGMRAMTSELPQRTPTSAFAHCRSLDGDRLVTTTHKLLLAHPAELIGDGVEVMALADQSVEWTRLEPVRRLPRNMAAVGRAHYWAALHTRRIAANGVQNYYSTLVPFARDGAPLAAQWRGAWVCKPTNLGMDAIVACSLIEDAQRPNAMLASVRDGVELTFPVAEHAYLEAFALRDAPTTAQGRRRALLHWVAKHMRASRHGRGEVKRHMRGVAQFDMGGYRVKLWSADGSAPSRAAWPVLHNVGIEPPRSGRLE